MRQCVCGVIAGGQWGAVCLGWGGLAMGLRGEWGLVKTGTRGDIRGGVGGVGLLAYRGGADTRVTPGVDDKNTE